MLAAVALFVTACAREPTAEEKARSDAADIAAVEAAQDRKPPSEPVTPQAITAVDKELHSLDGAACSFLPDTAPNGLPVLIAFPQKAMIKLEGKLLVLAADSASAELSHGARAEYVGRTHALHLAEGGEGNAAVVMITDEYERPVFRTTGILDCGA